MKDWKVRTSGDLDLTILRGLETAIGPEQAVAVRLVHSDSIRDVIITQIVMTAEDADRVARELLQAAQRARAKPSARHDVDAGRGRHGRR